MHGKKKTSVFYKRTNHPICPEWEMEFKAECSDHNLRMMKILSAAGIVMECFNIFMVLFLSKKGLGTLNNRIYFTFYLLLLIVLLLLPIFILGISRKGSKKKQRIFSLAFFYCFFFCLWSAGITFMDLQKNNNIIVYSFAVIFVSVLFYLKPWQSCLIFGGTQVLFLISTPFLNLGVNNIGIVVNTTVIASISLCMAYIRYRNGYESFINNQIILAQSEKIKEINIQLSDLVIQDSLTGLYNRRFLTDELAGKWSQYLRQEQTISVLMLDIDGFKAFNDRYGHLAGDECLKQLSNILKDSVEGQDCYIIRYGGEEFLLLFFGLTPEKSVEIAETIRYHVENEKIWLEFSNEAVSVTVSIGLCCVMMNTKSDINLLIKNADKALYEAKNAGKNRVQCFNI